MQRALLVVLLGLSSLSLATSHPTTHRHPRHPHSPAQPAPSHPSQITADACDGKDWGTAGEFDLYVLAQSWSAEFCYPTSHRTYPGCKQPTAWQRANLTLHGLWPQYANATAGHAWPQCCASTYGDTLNQSAVTAALPLLQTYWPSEQAPDGVPLADSLWQHEWAVHGTCVNVTQGEFLQRGVALMQRMVTPALIAQNVGSSVSRTALESAYNGGQACGADSCMVWLQCDGEYLTEVHTCWDRKLRQVMCPQLVVSDSGKCTGSDLKITKFS